MLIGSMCTGYGGLDAGVIAALGNARLAWAADNDPAAAAVIAYRMPGVLNFGDIRQARWEDIQPVDVMCAGFPCQPVSAAGKQKGTADERWLWPHIADAISRMVARPRLLVLENVPRLLTIEGGAAISQIIRTLAQLGYVGCYGIYSAAEAGAAHLRKRWFCVAADASSREFQRRRIPGLLGGQETEEFRQAYQRQRTGHSAAYSTTEASADALGVGRPPRRPPANRHRPGTSNTDFATDMHGIGREIIRRLQPGLGPRQDTDRRMPGNIRWEQYEPAIRHWENVTGTAVPYPVEPGRNGQPRLAAIFSEWLMGLSSGWVTGVPELSRSAQLRIIGNGVVPRQATMAVTSLLHILQADAAG